MEPVSPEVRRLFGRYGLWAYLPAIPGVSLPIKYFLPPRNLAPYGATVLDWKQVQVTPDGI